MLLSLEAALLLAVAVTGATSPGDWAVLGAAAAIPIVLILLLTVPRSARDYFDGRVGRHHLNRHEAVANRYYPTDPHQQGAAYQQRGQYQPDRRYQYGDPESVDPRYADRSV